MAVYMGVYRLAVVTAAAAAAKTFAKFSDVDEDATAISVQYVQIYGITNNNNNNNEPCVS